MPSWKLKGETPIVLMPASWLEEMREAEQATGHAPAEWNTLPSELILCC